MKIHLSKDLVEQLRADDLRGIHIRDAVSLDITPQGDYTTDIDADLSEDYLRKVEKDLDSWFNSLSSDSSWYENIDGEWVNISSTQLEGYIVKEGRLYRQYIN